MSHDSDERAAGAATSGRGTPVPVELAGSRRGHRAMALFLAGPVIWTVHFLVVYLVVEAGCTGAGPGLRLLDPPVPTIVTLAATAVAAVACLVSAALAHRRWRATRGAGDEEAGGLGAPDRDGTLVFGGYLLSLLGFVMVLFIGLPALVLPSC
jgi:hypothetical protein